MDIFVTKNDGTKVPFDANKINRSLERACVGIKNATELVTQIATETKLTVYDGITTNEIDYATINAAVQNIKDDILFDKIATRLFLKTIYRKVLGSYDKENPRELVNKHMSYFETYIKDGIQNNRLSPFMASKFDIVKITEAIDITRDELFVYSGVDTLINRYGMKDAKGNPIETPQYIFMRIAMGLSYNEKDPTLMAIQFYEKMSNLEYIMGGSCNLGAGTVRPALSNCFLLEMHDTIEHIAKSVSDVMLLSKGSGGIGASITKLRASGSPLKSNFGGASTGPVSFAKIIDVAIHSIMRGGKKKGALCFYMENWHLNFPDFIDWRHNAGDDHIRMRTANTACLLSDEFMKRVDNKEDWYMFDPAETADLNELYGSAFSARYKYYVEMAKEGKLRTYNKMPAEEQFKRILVSLQSTSHPWVTWKDPMNTRALNNNTGTIHMSNLCTEICLPQDKDNVAVCNLASINIARHLKKHDGRTIIDIDKLKDSVTLAVRQLDNLIDINILPIPEAVKSDKDNRAIGLGIMGFADAIEQLGCGYESKEAFEVADILFETISYVAINASADLAQERGTYKNFKGSMWSKGFVPIDTIEVLEKDRGIELTVDKVAMSNWGDLRLKVAKGMRNATLMAVAPNANIGLVAGTTPGIDPRFAQIFSRNKISGKYLDINHNLVKALKKLELWDGVKDKIIESMGNIQDMEEIPQEIRDIYKTSFSTSPYAFIEVAARAQKWVDQGLSRNMYLRTRDIDEIVEIYKTAWRKGLKTTYYLHMEPRHTAEQSTTNVNKGKALGKSGFGGVFHPSK